MSLAGRGWQWSFLYIPPCLTWRQRVMSLAGRGWQWCLFFHTWLEDKGSCHLQGEDDSDVVLYFPVWLEDKGSCSFLLPCLTWQQGVMFFYTSLSDLKTKGHVISMERMTVMFVLSYFPVWLEDKGSCHLQGEDDSDVCSFILPCLTWRQRVMLFAGRGWWWCLFFHTSLSDVKTQGLVIFRERMMVTMERWWRRQTSLMAQWRHKLKVSKHRIAPPGTFTQTSLHSLNCFPSEVTFLYPFPPSFKKHCILQKQIQYIQNCICFCAPTSANNYIVCNTTQVFNY